MAARAAAADLVDVERPGSTSRRSAHTPSRRRRFDPDVEAARPQWDVQVWPREGGPALVDAALSGRWAPGMRSPRATVTGRALLAVGAAAAAMGLQRQPLVAAADVLGEGFDTVLPPVADTLDAPRPALRRVGTPAHARGVSFAEGVRGDARECLTRARRERRAERAARRATRAARVVIEESARSQTPIY
jgi:hypothetical protein